MQRKPLEHTVFAANTEPDTLFDLIDDAHRPGVAAPVVGTLAPGSRTGAPLVDFPGNPFAGPLLARSTVSLAACETGAELLLVFERGDARRPVVIGALRPSEVDAAAPRHDAAIAERPEVRVDGRRLVFEAEQEIELRCGDASLLLRRDGKVVIRGRELLSRSSGRNRIKGAAVQIN